MTARASRIEPLAGKRDQQSIRLIADLTFAGPSIAVEFTAKAEEQQDDRAA